MPNAVVESKETAESYIPGDQKFKTPSVETDFRPSLVAPASAYAPVNIDRMDVDPEPVASSHKRPSPLGCLLRNRTLQRPSLSLLPVPTHVLHIAFQTLKYQTHRQTVHFTILHLDALMICIPCSI
jgi:hypothetical protein